MDQLGSMDSYILREDMQGLSIVKFLCEALEVEKLQAARKKLSLIYFNMPDSYT